MAIPRSRWALVIGLGSMMTPAAAPAQTSAKKHPDAAIERTPARGQPHPFREASWNPPFARGERLFDEGHYAEAQPEFEKAVRFCEGLDCEVESLKTPYIRDLLTYSFVRYHNINLFLSNGFKLYDGAALAVLGRYDEAGRRFAEMATYAERVYPNTYSTFAGNAYQGLAFVSAARGRYDEAADAYRLALAHVEKNEPQVGHPPPTSVALILAALADVEVARGRLDAAEPCIRQAAAVQQAQETLRMGPAPPDRATVLTVLAHLRFHQGRYSEAYDHDSDALAILREIRKDHPLAGFCLDGMGEVELVRNHLDLAEEHFREARKVREAALGKEHRDVASSLDGLGRVAAARGDRKAAESFFHRASMILDDALGARHPDTEAVAAHARALGRRSGGDAARPAARFLAIPTLPTLGWQSGYWGKDWRPTAANLLRKEARAAKGARPAPTPARTAPPSAGR